MTAGLVLRVTLGEMDPEDAFSVRLPPSFTGPTVGELFGRVFGAAESDRASVRSLLDVRLNPDLPEMYDALVRVFDDGGAGRCSLRFFAEGRDEVRAGEPVPAVDGVFSVVIEQRYTPLDYSVKRGNWESREALLEWLQERALLYFIGTHEAGPPLRAESAPDAELLPIAGRLRRQGLLEPDAGGAGPAVSKEGREALAGMMAEAEAQLSAYGIFGDVLYHEELEEAEFGTGSGADLAVQALEAEGIDTARAVFLLTLFGTPPDGLDFDWREAVQEEWFFEELLAPVADHDRIEDGLIDGVVERGLAYVGQIEGDMAELGTRGEARSRAKRARRSGGRTEAGA